MLSISMSVGTSDSRLMNKSIYEATYNDIDDASGLTAFIQ